ncbi:uncharacterized protein LOC110442636 [Mizuhopecten yessoensis]|uniref:Uncharacterized protein n=1 Tax=Mizuhopecten yessoensis TaxID=6573 RepID=A0A210PGR4_MIZYE|nr:uncharacterized protein LOC110442636 [Mizuhopecten yessoensis]OWF35675.1 hypothetical protein KP79_PYT04885 [Mizuhopecten yessoensis]
MYWSLAVAVCLIGQISGFTVFQETATPSFLDELTTQEPMPPTTQRVIDANEFDQALFLYDAPTHQLVMKLGHYCYIHGVTSSSQQLVHTADGLLKFESILMYLVAAGMHTQMTHADAKRLSVPIEHFCRGHDIQVVSRIHHSTTKSTIV